MTKYTIMRRSTRIRWEIPVLITSLDASIPFSECCETVAVNAHGCGLISSKRLEKGVPVKLGLLPGNHEATARVVDVVQLGEENRTWLLGLQLDTPANVWGVQEAPADWAGATQDSGAEQEKATPALTISTPLKVKAAVADSAGASSSDSEVVVAGAAASFDYAGESDDPIAVLEPEPRVAIEPAPVFANGNSSSLLRQLETELRSRADSLFGELENEYRRRNAAAVGEQRGGFQLRERDWSDLRRQLEQRLQDLLGDADEKMSAKLESWHQKVLAAEDRLEALYQMQTELKARLNEVTEALQEAKTEPAGDANATVNDAVEEDTSAIRSSVDQTATIQAEEIRQLQQWMQSLIQLLPQAVEQHAREWFEATEPRLRNHTDEHVTTLRGEFAGLSKQLENLAAGSDSKIQAAQAAEAALRSVEQELRESLQQSAHSLFEQGRAEFRQVREEIRTASDNRIQGVQAAEAALRSVEQELRESLQQSARNVFEEERAELQQVQKEIRTEGDRLQKLTDEWSSRFQELNQAKDTLQSIIRSPHMLEQQLKQGIGGRVDELQNQLSHEVSRLNENVGEMQRGLDSLSSQVSQQAREGSARFAEEMKQAAETLVRGMSNEASAWLKQRLQSDFEQKREALERAAARIQGDNARMDVRAQELRAQMEEIRSAREATEAMVTSLTQAASEQLQERAAAVAGSIRSQAEQELAQLQQQVKETATKVDEVADQRQQESAFALQQHIQALRAGSESMLRRVSEQVGDSLREQMSADLNEQRRFWKKERQDIETEKASIEARAAELSAEWENKIHTCVERASSETFNDMQARIERVATDVMQKRVAEAEAKLQIAFESLVVHAERTRAAIEKLVEAAQRENQRSEAQRSALQGQLDQAQVWLSEQTNDFRKVLREVLLEATGEIKGRIQMAVEMSKEPIEKRSRHAQAQLEELTARKTRELSQHMAELDKTVGPLLQARLNETLGEFQKSTEGVAKASMDRYEDELTQTLDSMLRVLRSKRAAHADRAGTTTQ